MSGTAACHLPLRPGDMILTKHAVELGKFSAQDMILDIGCGRGESLTLLQTMGLKAFGMDIKSIHSDNFFCGNAQNTPCKPLSFDGILGECVLSLLPERQKVLAAWNKICKPSARLIIHDVYAKTNQPQGLHGAEPLQTLNGAEPLRTLNVAELLHTLNVSGWKLIHSEDCSHYLAPFAAQLLWHGENCNTLKKWKNCGYALWIAQKI